MGVWGGQPIFSAGNGNGIADTVNVDLTGLPSSSVFGPYSYYNFAGDYTTPGVSDTFNLQLPQGLYVTNVNSFPIYSSTLYTVFFSDASGYVGRIRLVGNLNIIPFCFTAGAKIDTPDGPRRVEALAEGDMVLTRDNGAQPVRWVGRSKMTAETLRQHPHLRPVRIAADTLGSHDEQLVSPCHRMLVADWRAEALFGEAEVLVAARELINEQAIAVAHDITEVEYIHLLFDRHELVRVDGAWSESFHPAGISDSTSQATRDEVMAIFPQLLNEGAEDIPAVRSNLSPSDVRVLAI